MKPDMLYMTQESRTKNQDWNNSKTERYKLTCQNHSFVVSIYHIQINLITIPLITAKISAFS